jgi:hypothetical protein
VMKRKNPVRAAFIMVPVYFAITSGILTSKLLISYTNSSPHLPRHMLTSHSAYRLERCCLRILSC